MKNTEEIHNLMKQFEHGNGEWKQFINSIKISNIHGWNEQIFFRFPVVALVGENGIGKSTFLKAAVCAYANSDPKKNFYPSKMFMSTRWDVAAMQGATIEYKVRLGDEIRTLRWRKTNDWGFSPKTKKPKRNVYFLDISRTVPLDATAGYAKIAKIASEEIRNEETLDASSIRDLSYILGQEYTDGRFVRSVNTTREVGLLTKDCGEISQFHQGAGEDSVLDLFKLFQSIPPFSLLVIDEVENSLHPQAQRRLIRYLLKLARTKKLQIILSTHSPFVLDELPAVARIMLKKTSDKKIIMYEVSTQYALSTIDDSTHPELFVYLEDTEAVTLFWEILKRDTEHYDNLSKKISALAVGSASVLKTLDELCKENKLPYKGVAIVDGDMGGECPKCIMFPGNKAPEKQIILDLKETGWENLDNRFGIGSGSLFKIFDDATLLPDHHDWTEFIGDKTKKSKDVVWSILVEEWCKKCLPQEEVMGFINKIISQSGLSI